MLLGKDLINILECVQFEKFKLFLTSNNCKEQQMKFRFSCLLVLIKMQPPTDIFIQFQLIVNVEIFKIIRSQECEEGSYPYMFGDFLQI